jgi:ribosomal protein S18 acetylase RimI-like enzyme
VARAFHDSPWGKWAMPDESSREATYRRLLEAEIAGLFIPWGEAWILGGASVALWIPPASRPGAARFERRRGDAEYAAFGDREPLLRGFDDLVGSLRPEVEHWYLDTLATDPERMGQGLAGRLLDHGLARRDAEGVAVALDTEAEENVAFYRRRGFEVTARSRLPGDGPPIWMMLRTPR